MSFDGNHQEYTLKRILNGQKKTRTKDLIHVYIIMDLIYVSKDKSHQTDSSWGEWPQCQLPLWKEYKADYWKQDCTFQSICAYSTCSLSAWLKNLGRQQWNGKKMQLPCDPFMKPPVPAEGEHRHIAWPSDAIPRCEGSGCVCVCVPVNIHIFPPKCAPMFTKRHVLWTSLAVQRLRLCTPTARGPGSDPWSGN